MSYATAAGKIRQKIRHFTTDSFVTCILSRLHQKSDRGEAYKRSWILCLAIDWALELEPVKGAKLATQKDVQGILQAMWELQGKAMGIEQERDIWLSLRAFMLSQLRFQVPRITHSFFLLRLHTIMFQQGYKQAFIDDFNKATGVNLEEFFLFALWVDLKLTQEGVSELSLSQIISSLYPAFSISSISRILKLVGSPICNLKKLARPLPTPLKPETYFYEPLLINKPLILTDKSVTYAHPYILSIGISEFVLRTLKSFDAQRFKKKFTKSFEFYLGTALTEFQFSYTTEDTLNNVYREHNRQGKVVDFLHQDQGSSIFIDAKGVEPKEKLLVTDSASIMKDKLRDNLLSGVIQASRCAKTLSDIYYDNLAPFERRYSIVVTHQDFYCGSGRKLIQYLGEDLAHKITDAVDGQFPIENIHFFSVADFEGMLATCCEAGKTIADFLDFCTEQEREPETQTFDMRQRIEAFGHLYNLENKSPIGTQLLQQNLDTLLNDLAAKLTYSSRYWSVDEQKVPRFLGTLARLEQELKA
ncbi:GapS1 family protein [Pseudoalteromonas sp. T1lg75]|uniref:GapS1 family protein n=1 Tax=Pseudoalteromonas sp. T1lg75 TaxID=2077102 RepID=UPI000CF6ADB9|nr:hypothetical protein [Pseudoalteromonas sp. T1lg75]